tara:strand:- start:3086 stop:4096 length:1011 start_codon:yes stop_codon:yes gene_type:complete
MIKTINIDDIVLRLFNENGVVYPCHIENSPHYKLLCGEREPYDEYVKLMGELGRAKSGYMSTSDYLEFYLTFDYLGPMYNTELIMCKSIGHRYESWDGDHRLACLLKQKVGKVKVDEVYGEFKHIGFSNLIDIVGIMDGLEDCAIIKSEEFFPNYYDYDDLDIICRDRDSLTDIILGRLEFLKEYKYDIKVNKKTGRNHIDVTKPLAKRLNFRFDIMDEFPYHIPHQQISIDVNKEYLKVMLDRKESKDVMKPEAYIGEGKLSFLNETDDLVIRFLEWAWQPHKMRHIKAVRDLYKNENEFLELINKYTNVGISKEYMKTVFDDLEKREDYEREML